MPDRLITAWSGRYEPNETVARHSHPRAQLILILNGTLLIAIDEGSWLIPSGTAVWIPQAAEHELKAIGPVDGISLYIAPAARQYLPRQCRVIEVSPLLRELVKSAAAIDADGPLRRRDAHLFELLLDELENLRALSLWLPTPSDPRLYKLCQTLLSDPQVPARLDESASSLNTSSRSLSRYFRKQLGMSFGQWVRRARLISSIAPLSRGVSVLEVALELGYASPSAFSAMFRRTLGVSPRDFFKRDGEQPQDPAPLAVTPMERSRDDNRVEFLLRPASFE